MDISKNEMNESKDETIHETIHETIDKNDIKDEIKIIMRQTSYTREEAETYFEQFGSVEKCIHHYLGIKPKEDSHLSTNQKIFKSIRDFF